MIMINKKPKCKLTGTDGNVFAIIGNVSAALKKAGFKVEAEEFRTQAFNCGSYEGVLALCGEYVEIK